MIAAIYPCTLNCRSTTPLWMTFINVPARIHILRNRP